MAEEICTEGRWPAARLSIKFASPAAELRKEGFRRDVHLFLDRLQECASRLPEEEKARCGRDGVAAEISLKIDLSEKLVVLYRLFKYCNMDFHIFTGLLEILQRHFSDCDLLVPALQGYELAREIQRFLGVPAVECIYLKGDTGERLLMGGSPDPQGFEGIMEATARHYQERGGIDILAPGAEVPMFRRGPEGEEEVLWMQVRTPLSSK